MGSIKLVESKHIRSVWNEPENWWHFVVEGINAGELFKGWVQIVPPVMVETSGIKQYMCCEMDEVETKKIRKEVKMNYIYPAQKDEKTSHIQQNTAYMDEKVSHIS
ncbi:MAG: phage antirepressor protein [Bacteroidota bacterium]|jgi:hypothetical protein|nr:phage antirepressor protein [Bacteroidota bacterium]